VERLARLLEAQRITLAQLCQLYRASAVLPRLEDALRCHEVNPLMSWLLTPSLQCMLGLLPITLAAPPHHAFS
jgi:hypothetical protein